MSIKRGEIYWVYIEYPKGSEQSGRRPALILQNDIGNELAPTTIVAFITSKSYDKEYPTNVNLAKGVGGLSADSTVLLSQISTLDKSRLKKKIGQLAKPEMQKVDQAIKISLALT